MKNHSFLKFIPYQLLTVAITLAVSSMPVLANEDVQENFIPTYTTRGYPVKHATGFVHQANSAFFMANAPRVSFVDPNNKVPKQFTLRHKAGPVEDQGQCGSCWDFALTTTLRGSIMAHGKDPGPLSFNYLLNCDSKMQGCNGGDFTAADLLISPLGAPKRGSDGYYNAYQGKCQQEAPVASAKSYKLLGNDGGSFPGSPDPSVQDIAYVVGVLHQPVSIDLAVDDNWQAYSFGVYNNCSDNNPKDINHMVVIEGYDCEKSVDAAGNCVFDANGNLPKGVGHWIIRNSWGSSWGDSGYIKMAITDSKGRKCDAVASDALFFDLGE